MCPQAFLGDEGGEHADDERLALAGAHARKHRLRQARRQNLLALVVDPAGPHSKHEHCENLRMVRDHDDIVLLLHAFRSSSGDLKHGVPICGQERHAAPLRRLFKLRSHARKVTPQVHVRRQTTWIGTCQGRLVDRADASQQLPQHPPALARLTDLELEPLLGQLEVLFGHVLEGEDDGIQGLERARPIFGRRLAQDRRERLLGAREQGRGLLSSLLQLPSEHLPSLGQLLHAIGEDQQRYAVAAFAEDLGLHMRADDCHERAG
mmetsp:Transcript_102313/g.328106  ORF Transcript_102313/g.328106 Transcript_102313/m.328106 type:complete len:264 (+) Transcript_102313:2008-2799(+)